MSGGDGLGWMRAMAYRLDGKRIEELERRLGGNERDRAKLREIAVAKLRDGTPLSRAEVAAYFDVSEKTVQRWDDRGELPHCSGLGRVVRYRSSDVLRLASAR